MDSSASQQNQKERPSDTPKPPVAMAGPGKLRAYLTRTSGAFVAEYSIFLIALGIVLTNLSWMFYVFFGFIVNQMNGSAFLPDKLFILWVVVSSAIALPIALGLWRRTQGELTLNKELKGELQGGARGFRSFWLVVDAMVAISMAVTALFAPVAALINGTDFAQVLLGVTMPALLTVALAIAGWYLVTRRANSPGKSVLVLWAIVGLTTLLFVVNFVWSMNTTIPSPQPYTRPPVTNDPYMYSDPYYDYNYDY